MLSSNSPTPLIEDAVAAVSLILDQIAKDFEDAVSSWALWEVANGFPLEEDSAGLRQSAMTSYSSKLVGEVQRLSLVNTLLALSRIIDSSSKGRGNERQSLDKVADVVLRPDLLSFLTADISHSGRSDRTFVKREDILSGMQLLVRYLDPSNCEKHSQRSIRENIKPLRDQWIAHSLSNRASSKVTPFLVRDALVFCGAVTHLSRLVLAGRAWNPKYYWMMALRNAQRFWGIYEVGASVASTPSADHTDVN